MDVQFHSDGYERAHAAVNVKVRSNFALTDRLEPYYARLGFSMEEFNNLAQSVIDNIETLWWDEDIQSDAQELGFSKVYSEGRSGGWAIPLYNDRYLYEEDFEDSPELLKMYKEFKNICKLAVDGLDQQVYNLLKEGWFDEEVDFLKEHSLAVQVLIHNKVWN